MFGLGTTELIIILVIVLIIFGAGKLPKVMADLGRGVKSFKKGMEEKESEILGAKEEISHQVGSGATIEGDVKQSKTAQ